MEISDWRVGRYPKKYSVLVSGTHPSDGTQRRFRVSFGDQRYEQYEDRTPLKVFSYLNHYDKQRRRLYHARHRGDTSWAGLLAKKYLW